MPWPNFPSDEVKVRSFMAAVGGITESDVNLRLLFKAGDYRLYVACRRLARKHGSTQWRGYSLLQHLFTKRWDEIKSAMFRHAGARTQK